jgi:hypothetical protein
MGQFIWLFKDAFFNCDQQKFSYNNRKNVKGGTVERGPLDFKLHYGEGAEVTMA